VKKPAHITYGVADSPPILVTVFNGVQLVGLISINLVYPLLVFRVADTPVELVANLMAIGMLVLGVATFMQAMRLGPVGSGFMCPATFTASYFPPSLLAAKLGGLPMVFGMTLFAGVLEGALAPLLNRLRAVFPIEISGLVIFMIGWSAGIAGLRLLLADPTAPLTSAECAVAGLTLATMVALNVWGKGLVRMLCALIGIACGYLAAGFAGLVDARQFAAVTAASWVGIPTFGHVSWTFDAALAAPFAIACIAAALKAVGTITICQRMNDADWVRPDMRSATRGVLADGMSTALAGVAGAMGTNTSTPAVGLASATGVGSRKVAYAVGTIFVMLSLFPKLAATLAAVPRAVAVAALLFAVSFVIINGLQVIASRLLDARRTLTLGLAFVGGGAVDVFPAVAASAPKALIPVVGSSFVFATMIALVLNVLFRVGVKRTVNLKVEAEVIEPQKIEDFFKLNGAKWGARPDVVTRATFGVIQLIDAVRGEYWRGGALDVKASFDEFNLNVDLAYDGDALQFPEQRPSNKQIRESEDGARLMAGYMLRKCADRLRSQRKDGKAIVHLHYDH
jgi:NCS2 family nucleobase:cation symporter-2